MNANENTHDSLLERALVSFDLAAEHHIAHCQPCQTEREKVEAALRQFGAASRQSASRPEIFWEQQASRIRAAQRQYGQPSRLTMTLVPTVVVLLLVAFAMLGRGPGVRPVAVATPAVQSDSDHQLLLEIERAVRADTPLALEPATLMVEESDGNLPLHTSSEKKETRSHEN